MMQALIYLGIGFIIGFIQGLHQALKWGIFFIAIGMLLGILVSNPSEFGDGFNWMHCIICALGNMFGLITGGKFIDWVGDDSN